MNIIRRSLFGAFVAIAAWIAPSPPAIASQGACVLPTTGTVSGLTLVQDMNACIEALMTNNSGATAPVNGTGGVSLTYQLWLKTGDKTFNIYDAANWLPMGTVDASGHIWQPPIGGGYYTTLASATTADLCSIAPSLIKITGTTTITGFGSACVTGQMKTILFNGILQLTYNATSLILPNNGNNITTAAGDRAWAVSLGGGNWEIAFYQRANGTALSASAAFTGAVSFQSVISPSALTVNTDDWNPTDLATSNTIRVSCSNAINITGITAPATDGQVLVLHNIGLTNACTLVTQSASSTAGNRFAIPMTLPLGPGQSVGLRYDLTTARWRGFGPLPYAPTTQVFSTAASGTYTTPQGVIAIRVRACGGGGGGGGGGTSPVTGGTGGTTSFNSITALGGVGGQTSNATAVTAPGAGGVSGSGTVVFRRSGDAGGQGLFVSASLILSGFGGGSLLSGITLPGSYGSPGVTGANCSGGSGASVGSGAGGGGAGGGGGEGYELRITNPAATYAYIVGAAGTAGTAVGANGGVGGPGEIVVDEFYNFLLKRDIAPASNDNTPMFLNVAA